MRIKNIVVILFILLLFGCSSTRYVPQGKYLLGRNYVLGKNGKDTFKDSAISPDILMTYIGHKDNKPNKRIAWFKFSLGFYNTVDTSKHTWWHRLWREKLGSPPVIYDSNAVYKAKEQAQEYLRSKGYLNSKVTDSVVYKNRKAKVYYIIQPNEPYKISYYDRNIEDPFINEVLQADTLSSLIKKGDNFNRQTFDAERGRIVNEMLQMGFYGLRRGDIRYDVDSSWNDNTLSVMMNMKGRFTDFDSDGNPQYANHSIYRVSRVVVNTNYVDPLSIKEHQGEVVYDTIIYRGIEIVYSGRLHIKPEIVAAAVTFSPNSLYNPKDLDQTNQNIRDLGYNTLMYLSQVNDTTDIVKVTIPSASGEDVETTEKRLECTILCTPYKKLSFTQGFDLSMTSTYTTAALTLGYQNRNLFRGAEELAVSLRGAYDLMKNREMRNSYEIGLTASISVPRFTPSFGFMKSPNIRHRSTRLQLNYNIQERPFYHRTILGGTYSYNWANRKGAKWMFSPADISLVHVPWRDSTYFNGLDNKYLQNSYQSQLIAGLLFGYDYNSNVNYRSSGYNVRFFGDVNGNLLSLFNSAMPIDTLNGESFRAFGGQRYAQYVRGTFEYSGRHNMTRTVQSAWRFHLSAGLPYGNSSSLPFDRKYYVGGSNSMRGWQIRTLGLGSSLPKSPDDYSYVMGDMRLEGNAELRFNVYDWLNIATFVDAGNIWLNSKERDNNDQNFKLGTFYKQLAMNTGLGFRFDISFVIVRLDWGLKLRNPVRAQGDRWFKDMRLSQTAMHFAIGLPF